MSTVFTKLLQFWHKAADDLGLEITAPFNLSLSSGCKLEAILLIHQFGGAKGMLIFTNYGDVEPYVNEIVDAGYGFSILDEPGEHEEYNKEEYIELLTDWGWCGDNDSWPVWFGN
jgi:hypothetical protein